jgi:hypothetical protein
MKFFNWREERIPKFKKENKMEVENLNLEKDKTKWKVKLVLDLLVESVDGYDFVTALSESKVYFDNPSSMEVVELYFDKVILEDEFPKTLSITDKK